VRAVTFDQGYSAVTSLTTSAFGWKAVARKSCGGDECPWAAGSYARGTSAIDQPTWEICTITATVVIGSVFVLLVCVVLPSFVTWGTEVRFRARRSSWVVDRHIAR